MSCCQGGTNLGYFSHGIGGFSLQKSGNPGHMPTTVAVAATEPAFACLLHCLRDATPVDDAA